MTGFFNWVTLPGGCRYTTQQTTQQTTPHHQGMMITTVMMIWWIIHIILFIKYLYRLYALFLAFDLVIGVTFAFIIISILSASLSHSLRCYHLSFNWQGLHLNFKQKTVIRILQIASVKQSQFPHQLFILLPEALLRLRKQLKQKRLTWVLNNWQTLAFLLRGKRESYEDQVETSFIYWH